MAKVIRYYIPVQSEGVYKTLRGKLPTGLAKQLKAQAGSIITIECLGELIVGGYVNEPLSEEKTRQLLKEQTKRAKPKRLKRRKLSKQLPAKKRLLKRKQLEIIESAQENEPKTKVKASKRRTLVSYKQSKPTGNIADLQ